MKHVQNLKNANLDTPSLVTIGVFDGLHTGHQTLIKQLVDKAHSDHKLAVVITFFPHPDKVLHDVDDRYYLMTSEQRAQYLLDMGIDCVITHPFDDEIRQMRASDFVDQWVEHLKISELWVGSDFAMGHKREGNVEFLTAQGQEKGFSVTAIDLIMTDTGDKVIRSSEIREHLYQGDVDTVRGWLGRGYAVVGEVVQGQQRGRTIGFPTANVDVWSEQIIPANGVYAGWAKLGDETFKAVTNIGIRPTFDGDNVTVEAHLLDFDRDIYGKTLEVSFETRLRAEKKFNGIDELVAQIKADANSARRYLDENPIN
jgi:riboflavin kinase / FMN adenylyltransferase